MNKIKNSRQIHVRFLIDFIILICTAKFSQILGFRLKMKCKNPRKYLIFNLYCVFFLKKIGIDVLAVIFFYYIYLWERIGGKIRNRRNGKEMCT